MITVKETTPKSKVPERRGRSQELTQKLVVEADNY